MQRSPPLEELIGQLHQAAMPAAVPTSEACRQQQQSLWTPADLGILWVMCPAGLAARPAAEQHTLWGLAAEGAPIVAGLHTGPPRLHARHAAAGAGRQRRLGSLQRDT